MCTGAGEERINQCQEKINLCGKQRRKWEKTKVVLQEGSVLSVSLLFSKADFSVLQDSLWTHFAGCHSMSRLLDGQEDYITQSLCPDLERDGVGSLQCHASGECSPNEVRHRLPQNRSIRRRNLSSGSGFLPGFFLVQSTDSESKVPGVESRLPRLGTVSLRRRYSDFCTSGSSPAKQGQIIVSPSQSVFQI